MIIDSSFSEESLDPFFEIKLDDIEDHRNFLKIVSKIIRKFNSNLKQSHISKLLSIAYGNSYREQNEEIESGACSLLKFISKNYDQQENLITKKEISNIEKLVDLRKDLDEDNKEQSKFVLQYFKAANKLFVAFNTHALYFMLDLV